MAVARREKNTDPKYKKVIGVRPPLIEDNNKQGREPEIEDIIEDLRDDVNAMCDLSALNEGKTGITSSQASAITSNSSEVAKIAPFTFTYRAGKKGARGTLTIEHISSRDLFVIQA